MATDSMSAESPSRSLPPWTGSLLALGLAASGFLLLAFGLLRTSSSHLVEVGRQRYLIRTHASTVGDALQQAGLELHPEDIVTPELDSPLEPGQRVQIVRANPVALSADGKMVQFRTHAHTARELLQEAGLALGPADEIWLNGQQVDPGARLHSAVIPQAQDPDPREEQLSAAADDSPPLVSVRRATSLILDDNGVTTALHSTAATVAQVLEEHDVSLFLGDGVTPGLQDRVEPGMVVAIQRSVPAQIEVDGHTLRTRTLAADVAGVLGQEGIALVGLDSVQPELDSPIRPNMTLRVTRIREELVVEFDPIPYETVWVADPKVEIDSIKLLQEGQIGLTKRRDKVRFENGQEVERVLEDTWSEQKPMDKKMAYGTKIVIRTMDTPDGPIEYWRKIRVYTTAYTAATSGKPRSHPRYGYTRLGWKAAKGVVAVDPDVIHLKAKMYVPGYGFARAGDTGGGIKGKMVDLCFDEGKYESWHWWTDIYLLTPVPKGEKVRWVLPDYPRFPDRKRR